LGAASRGGPVCERFQIVAILPGKAKKLSGVQMFSFFAKEGFKAPLNIGAFPGLQAVARRSEPIKLKEMPHEIVGYQFCRTGR
jgi:hypothetical protein